MKEIKDYDKEDYPILKELYNKIEPYHYFNTYLQVHKAVMNQPDPVEQLIFIKDRPEQFLTQRKFVKLGEVGMKEGKIIQLDKDLLPLLEDTEPCFEELHMPYPAMFVNHQFDIGKFRINGFLLFDIKQFRDMGYEIETVDKASDIRILSVTLNTEDGYEFYSIEPLEVWSKEIPDRQHYYDHKQEYKDMVKAAKLIIKLGANLISTMNNNPAEIEMVNVNYSKERNLKRIKRGKMPHSDKLVLRLGGHLKIYAHYYAGVRGSIDIRFFVRGHWMRFKAERYVHKRGTKNWIIPFYKGEDKAKELYYKIVEVKRMEK